MNWVGHTEGLFGRQTKRNGLNGLVLTFRTTLRMSCGQMNRKSAIGGSAAGRKANDPAQSLVPSIQSRWHGATEVCAFDGIMDASKCVHILQVALLPTLPIENLWHKLKVSEYHSEMFPKC